MTQDQEVLGLIPKMVWPFWGNYMTDNLIRNLDKSFLNECHTPNDIWSNLKYDKKNMMVRHKYKNTIKNTWLNLCEKITDEALIIHANLNNI